MGCHVFSPSQWLNQSHNACVNYANRNATKVSDILCNDDVIQWVWYIIANALYAVIPMTSHCKILPSSCAIATATELDHPLPLLGKSFFLLTISTCPLPLIALPGLTSHPHLSCLSFLPPKPVPTRRFVEGYVAAVAAACSIAVALNSLLQRAGSWTPRTKMVVQRFIPFPAVGEGRSCVSLVHVLLHRLEGSGYLPAATASTLNAILMRNHELREGIVVVDDVGCAVGTSVVAARRAVKETAVTRAVLPAPILLIPPVIMAGLEK